MEDRTLIERIRRAVASGVAFLADGQLPDGSFTSESLYAENTTGESSRTYTTFAASLVGMVLGGMKLEDERMNGAARGMCERAAMFLMGCRGQFGSWNYWQKGHAPAPIPDDLTIRSVRSRRFSRQIQNV